MVQLVQNIVSEYMRQNTDKTVSVRGGGSGTGIAALLNGSTQIANASRKMKEKEWDKASSLGMKVKEHIVGLDGIAVLVHPTNRVDRLSIKKLGKIFTGTIKNWKEVGGNDAPIAAISRENNSGTHVYFKEEVLRQGNKKSTLEFGDKITYAVSSQSSINQIKTNKNGIAYVGMSWIVDGVKALNVSKDDREFYPPSIKNIKKNRYPIARTLQMYTNEKFKARTDDFIKFVFSKDGQAVTRKLGFIPIK